MKTLQNHIILNKYIYIIVITFNLFVQTSWCQVIDKNYDTNNHQDNFKNLILKASNQCNSKSKKSGNAILLDSLCTMKNYGDFKIFNHIYYTYTNTGKLNQSVNLQMNEYGEFEHVTETKKYNANELLTEYKIEVPKNFVEFWVEDTSLITTYLEKCKYENLLIKQSKKTYVSLFDERTTDEYYTYNSHNNLTLFVSDELYGIDTFEYKYNNEEMLEYIIRSYNSSYYLIEKYKYENLQDTFRTYKNISHAIHDNKPIYNSIIEWKKELLFEEIYDDKNRLISFSKKFLSFMPTWENEYITEFEYNNNNQLVKSSYSLISDDGYEEILRLENTYNSDNMLSQSISHFYDDKVNNWVIYESKTYYYSSHLVDIAYSKNSQIGIYPNPAQNYIMVPETLIGASYSIYSIKGELIKQGKITSSFIDVNEFKTGTYLMSANLRNQTFRDLIIKR